MAINVEFTDPGIPPSSSDAVNFRTRADSFVSYIASFVTKLITFVAQINSTEANINAKESSAVASATVAVASANYKGIFVQGTSSALVGESWSYNGASYRCAVSTSNSPVIEPASWVSTSIDAVIHSATVKATLADTDELPLLDGATSFGLKKTTWSNIKASLLTYFDTLYSRTVALFGIGQTWQDVLTSRASGVTYTNTTGKPIMIIAQASANPSGDISLTIGTLLVMRATNYGTGGTQRANVVGIVPNGATYIVTVVTGSLSSWTELR